MDTQINIIELALLLIILGLLTVLVRRHQPIALRREEVILDTCALIDGRIVDVAHSGFLTSDLVIPRSVIAELQYMADHGDSHKRERARYGLDVAKRLQEEAHVRISTDSIDDSKPVDERLISLAKKRKAALCTVDFNLNKVAQIEGVRVLNVNELAQELRPHILPGETSEIKIVDKGQDRQQGIGYLPDGSMVVVERAGSKIGRTIRVEFSRMLQTQAGRMMFAVPLENSHQAQEQHSQTSSSAGNSGGSQKESRPRRYRSKKESYANTKNSGR